MVASLGILTYAGPAPAARRAFGATCGRAIVWMITTAALVVFVAVRAALLLTGFACLFAGLVLLTLGGKRDAARKLLAWRERFVDLCRLWVDDILRVLRRRRRRGPEPLRALPVASVASQ